MRQALKALSLIALASILQGCATPTPRIAQTPSGAPEVFVAKSVEEVRNALLPHLLANGWQLTSDHTNNIAVVQRMSAK